MHQSFSPFSVNILCWCLGKVAKTAINKKVNLITLLNFPSLVKPKGEEDEQSEKTKFSTLFFFFFPLTYNAVCLGGERRGVSAANSSGMGG